MFCGHFSITLGDFGRFNVFLVVLFGVSDILVDLEDVASEAA